MIHYGHGTWGMAVLCRLKGSVIPKALVWSVPCAMLTIGLHMFFRDAMVEAMGGGGSEGIDTIWSGYNFILGFLIVFRSNQAYSRFWESVSLTHKIRGQWTNAFSSLLAFCSPDPAKKEAVNHFREYLLRLMSLLHCYALHQVCELADDRLEVVDLSGLSPDTVEFLHSCESSDRAETVMLWIEKLIVESDRNKLFEVAPPVLTRAFAELSAGMVNMSELRKITEVPFPFPYSQFLSYMMVLQWLASPVVACQLISKWWWAGAAIWLLSTSYWTLFYIAQEIDMPFGEDSNDLPVELIQHQFNENLLHLSSTRSYILPDFISAVSVKRTTAMSMTRQTLRASKLQTSFPKLKKALEQQLEREEMAEEALELEQSGQWHWQPHPRRTQHVPEEPKEDTEDEEVGIEATADPVFVSSQGIKTVVGPVALEAASRRGITLQEPVSLEVLQEVLMEAVDRSCEPEDVVALVAAAAESEVSTSSRSDELSLNELMRRLKDLSAKVQTSSASLSQEEFELPWHAKVRERSESLKRLIHVLSGTVRRPEVRWNV